MKAEKAHPEKPWTTRQRLSKYVTTPSTLLDNCHHNFRHYQKFSVGSVPRFYKESWDDHVKYLFVIVDKRITWRHYIEMTEVKAFRTFLRIQSLFKIERLSSNIKLNLHEAGIRSVMAYTCPAWELAADTYLLKWQNKVFRSSGRPAISHGFQSCLCIRKSCTQQEKLYKFTGINIFAGQETRHRKYEA
jgi:hypothetical protein